MCLKKQFGGLGLRDTKTWNEAFLTKTLWNIHSKKDSLRCKWVHHIYIMGGSLWTILPKNSFPPLMYSILKVGDKLMNIMGTERETIQVLETWNVGARF